MARANILLVDDHPLSRVGLRHILEDSGDGHHFGEAESVPDATRQLRSRDWDIIILDLTLKGRSGMELLTQVRREHPRLPVLVVTMHPEREYGLRALRAGANGFLSKDAAPDLLAEAVQRLLAGDTFISPALTRQLVSGMRQPQHEAPHHALSDREFQILILLASGKRPTEIASLLALSVNTVSTYRSRILRKLHLEHTGELIHYAIQQGLT